jgi:hypothetical protein
METNIKLSTIQQYHDYLKELKRRVDNDIPFETGSLCKEYGISGTVNTFAQKAGILKIIGRGRHVKYRFLVSDIEPIHARRTLNFYYEYNHERNKKNYIEKKDQQKKPDKQKVDPLVNKILAFFEVLQVLIKLKVSFSLVDIARQYEVRGDVIGAALDLELISKSANGYVFNKPVNTDFASAVFNYLKKQEEEQDKKRKEQEKIEAERAEQLKKKLEDEERQMAALAEATKKAQAVKQIVRRPDVAVMPKKKKPYGGRPYSAKHYYLFGLKILTTITVHY